MIFKYNLYNPSFTGLSALITLINVRLLFIILFSFAIYIIYPFYCMCIPLYFCRDRCSEPTGEIPYNCTWESEMYNKNSVITIFLPSKSSSNGFLYVIIYSKHIYIVIIDEFCIIKLKQECSFL